MNNISIIDLAHRAQTSLASGQLEEAKSLYSRLCQLDDKNEEHWLTLAALSGESGEINEALEYADKAIDLDASYVEAYLTKAHLLMKIGKKKEAFDSALEAAQRDDTYDEAMLFITGLAGQLKRYDELEKWAQKTVELLPTNVDALLNLSFAKYELTKYDEAEDSFNNVLKIDATNHQALIGLARSIAAQERHEEAMTKIKSFLAIDANNSQAIDLLAQCLINLKRDDEAHEILVKLVESNVTYVFPYIHLADILVRRGDHMRAIKYLEQSLNITDEPLEALDSLARIFSEFGMHQLSLSCCKKVLEIDPDNKSAPYRLTIALTDMSNYEEAFKEVNSLLDDAPSNPIYLGIKASLFDRLGKPEEAYQIIEPLLNDSTAISNIVSTYANICHKYDKCDDAAAMLYQVLEKPDLDKTFRRRLLFTLAKLEDKLHNYNSAFEAANAANALKPYSYDHDKFTNNINELIRPDITALIKKPRILSSVHRVNPVFIVGMMRSGTSLVEQIIASHPKVLAGGERHEIVNLVSQLPNLKGINTSYPECLKQLSPDLINQMLASYDSFTRKLDPGVTLMTDKMPANYKHLIFIRMLFPNARFIHCVRNPLDTCLSSYFLEFTGFHDYAYKLEDLGNNYREYKRLMNHYRDVDKIPFMEVQYEDLVHNTEAVTRKMIDYCGLEWNESCLHYYDSDRIVRTASHDQVNKPIYTGSIDKWKHYEEQLKPLQDALESRD